MVVQEEPVNENNKPCSAWQRIGIERGKPFKPDIGTVQILARAAKDAQEYLLRTRERRPGDRC